MRCPLCSRPRLACVVPRVCAAATLDPASTPWVWRPPSQWRGGEAPAEREEHRASAPPRGPWGPCWHSWLARFLSLSVGCALCTKPVCGGRISGVVRCAGSMSVALEARPFQARTEKAVDGSFSLVPSLQQAEHKLQCAQFPPVYCTGSLPPRGGNFQAPDPVFVLDQEGGTVPTQMCAF